jgi:predicted DNA-binding transcriptional regulator YafY
VRADRLLTLVLLLQARGRMTATDLAAELEVSVRTVYRDLEALSAAGVPVFAEPGPHGGCQLIDGYRFPLRPEESEALLLLGVPDVLRELDLAASFAEDSRRSRPAGGPFRVGRPRAGPAGKPALVHLDMPAWFRSPEVAPELAVLAAAVRQRRRLQFSYARGPDCRAAPRTVAPLGLVNKAGIWYLVAMTKGQQPTVFRAARITSARVTTEPARRPAGFDLAAFWQQWSAEFAGSRPKLPVTVRASARARAVFPEVFGDPIRAVLSAAGPPDEAGWQELTLTFEHEYAAAHRLAGFGAEVEVVSPPRVRDLLVVAARGILSRYGATC